MPRTPTGQRDHYITIQAPTTVRDATYGSVTDTWADAANRWAKASFGAGGERTELEQIQSSLQAVWVMQTFATINSTMRIKEVVNGVPVYYQVVSWFHNPVDDETIVSTTSWREGTV